MRGHTHTHLNEEEATGCSSTNETSFRLLRCWKIGEFSSENDDTDEMFELEVIPEFSNTSEPRGKSEIDNEIW